MAIDPGYEKASVELVESVLDDLSPASSSEVYIATRGVDARAIAAVAAARADAGGGGGGDVTFDGDVTIETPFDPGHVAFSLETDGVAIPAATINSSGQEILTGTGGDDGMLWVRQGGAPSGGSMIRCANDGSTRVSVHDEAGAKVHSLEADGAGAGLAGFYGTAPIAQPEIPATPNAQDIADVLVALGLATQA